MIFDSAVVAFRADASLAIGSGHVMRCLTLADSLKAQGAECFFICREHSGNLINHIETRGYKVYVLCCTNEPPVDSGGLAHSEWLCSTQERDAHDCISFLESRTVDWLVVDHYALDSSWERLLKVYCKKLMVIDDLADRGHVCDLLVDQNLGRTPSDYDGLVPTKCKIFAGAQYSLLRPEFEALRNYSLQRRGISSPKKILITMGGVDQFNVTGQVLKALKQCSFPSDTSITVVMGATAPWIDQVKMLALEMPWVTEVLVGISDMAQKMADSDLAIGAAGSTSWERCCLGLPTLMVVLADNQISIANELSKFGAAFILSSPDEPDFVTSLKMHTSALLNDGLAFRAMQLSASAITSGGGCSIISKYMLLS